MPTEGFHAISPPNASTTPPTDGRASSAWPAWNRTRLVVTGATLALVGVLAGRHLLPSVGFSDAGDFQTASAMLGIMHPPGYAPLVTLGFFLTRMPGVDPAYLVSLGCLASGLAVLGLCMMMQMRLGVGPWLASATTLALSLHPRTWRNLVEPEVYGPSMAFLAAAAYLLIRHARRGTRRDLAVSAFLFGVAVACRPVFIWMAPFFAAAGRVARRARPGPRSNLRDVGLAVACVAAPVLYSIGFLWVRDAPGVEYNYIQMHNAESRALPEATAGAQAKVRRIWYHVSAREFRPYLTREWRQARLRLRWLRHEFFLTRPVTVAGFTFFVGPVLLWPALALLAAGAVLAWRQCRSSLWVLTGLIAGNVMFVCTYRIYGLAADLTALMFAGTVLIGVALSAVRPWRPDADSVEKLPARDGAPRSSASPNPRNDPPHRSRDSAGHTHPLRRSVLRRFVAAAPAALMAMIAIFDTPFRPSPDNAVPFLRAVDMATLPRDAVICSGWFHSTPLWYAKYILTGRRDVEIVNTMPHLWLKRTAPYRDRPVFFVQEPPDAEKQAITQDRNLWRLVRTADDSAQDCPDLP